MTYLFIRDDGLIYGYHTKFVDGALETNIDSNWLDEHTGKLYLKDNVFYIKQETKVDKTRLFELHNLLTQTDWKVIVNHELKALDLPAKYDEQVLHDTRQAWRDEINALELQEDTVEWVQVEAQYLPEPETITEEINPLEDNPDGTITPFENGKEEFINEDEGAVGEGVGTDDTTITTDTTDTEPINEEV
jgi:hypothetical protein